MYFCHLKTLYLHSVGLSTSKNTFPMILLLHARQGISSFSKCVPSWEKLLWDKSALSHKSQKPAKKHHWWTLFCRFVTASPEPQLQHKVCAGRYVMQACTFCHGRHARAAGGMNVDIRGDAQIGSTDCFFRRQAASQSACVSWIKTLRSLEGV